MEPDVIMAAVGGGGASASVLGFFLKRALNRVDRVEAKAVKNDKQIALLEQEAEAKKMWVAAHERGDEADHARMQKSIDQIVATVTKIEIAIASYMGGLQKGEKA